jgi:small subunit ribosomal protein S6
MRPYEVMLILDGTAEDTAVQANIDRVKDVVTAGKGKVGQIERWGRRRFAYELKHKWEGNYTLLELSAEPSTVAELDRVLLLSDDVVRHKIIRLPESVAGRGRPASNPEAAEKAAAPESESESK